MVSSHHSNTILRVQNLSKIFTAGGRNLTILDDVCFEVGEGSTESIVGPSGSGKTTLLGLCAGLDAPTSGKVFLNEVALHTLNEDARARLRNQWVGFVFQSFQLLPTLTALENVMVPLELRGEKKAGARALALLHRVGLGERAQHYPIQLSGGEQQRVALARAFINKPKILFADEPTGNLDTETSEQIAEVLFELNRASGTTLILVTHDPVLASRSDRVLKIENGRLEARTA